MDVGALDAYTKVVLRKSGWYPGRTCKEKTLRTWIDILSEEGFELNDQAYSILRELGDISIRVRSTKRHCGATMQFNPVNGASGEYDRMEDFTAASGENMFPLGELYQSILFAGESGRIYVGDWMSLMIAGDTIEGFLNDIFEPETHCETIWVNDFDPATLDSAHGLS